MSAARKDALKLSFDRRLKLEFHGTMVTSDGGLLAYRELDDAHGCRVMISWTIRFASSYKNRDVITIL